MSDAPKRTVPGLRGLREKGKKIIAVTAYDYTFARLVDGIADLVLVGDSLGMVVQGHSTTIPVTLEEMAYHAKIVSRGIRLSHLSVDMPFLSYPDPETALKNAAYLFQKGGAESVKLEGGVTVAPMVERLVSFGIPVLGHIGLTPQSVHALGGYRVQGRETERRESILNDALALEEAGAFAVVLEGIPIELSSHIRERIQIPTIGIGAGIHCDGQILVLQDLLGLDPEFEPRFVKRFAELGEVTRRALKQYAEEVQNGKFPAETHSY